MIRNTLAGLLLLLTSSLLAAPPDNSLQLTLPGAFYAVEGVEMNVYFDNVVLTQTPEAYTFEVSCDIGETQQRRWTITPSAAQVGEHPWKVTVRDSDGKQLATAMSVLHITAADAGKEKKIRLLIVGDSLTHATAYPNELARLLSLPGNPEWKMLGTHKPKQAAPGVAHEGYGGWTWQRFVSQYEPKPDGTYRKRSSPFVYLGKDGKPSLDVARYLREECGGDPPDYVIFLLGINDCFSAPPNDPDERIDTMFNAADILLHAFRQSAPQAKLAVCLTTPPNSRQGAFQANYKDRYSRWGWKRIQHRLVQLQLDRYGKSEDDLVYLPPTELNIDPIDGYPANNGVHPNTQGYKQIAASMYAWLKSDL